MDEVEAAMRGDARIPRKVITDMLSLITPRIFSKILLTNLILGSVSRGTSLISIAIMR
jgi:hypothetical protein